MSEGRRVHRPKQTIEHEDLRFLVIYAVRYALGRGRTTAPEDVTGIALRHLYALADEDIRGMVRDIEMEQRVVATVGAPREWDHETWTSFRQRLTGEIGQRGARAEQSTIVSEPSCHEMRFGLAGNDACTLPGGHEGEHRFAPHDCARCGRFHGVCRHCGTTHGDGHLPGCQWASWAGA